MSSGRQTLLRRGLAGAVAVGILATLCAAGQAQDTAAETTPPAALEKAEPPTVVVRRGEHGRFSRIVFDWPSRVPYTVDTGDDALTVRFELAASLDTRAFRRRLPKAISDFDWKADGEATVVSVAFPPGTRVSDFRLGNRVAFDFFPNAERQPPRPSDRAAEKAGEPAAADKQAPAPSASGTPAAGTPEPAPKTAKASATPIAPSAPSPVKSDPAPPAPAGGPTPAPASAPPPAVAADAPAAKLPAAVELPFRWQEPVAAAVFSRAGALWVVFDKPLKLDIAALKAAGDGLVRGVQQFPHARASILRLEIADGVSPRVSRSGLDWIVSLEPAAPFIRQAIPVEAETVPPELARLFLPIAAPGPPVDVVDPEIGDTLVVVPVVPLGSGFAEAKQYAQLTLLPTVHGIAIRPLIDALRVRSLREGVEITTDGGLKLTPNDTPVRSGDADPPDAERSTLLAIDRSTPAAADGFSRRRSDLHLAVADAALADREARRINLARFSLANGLAAETLGILRQISDARPEAASESWFLALRGVAAERMGRVAAARQDLANPALDGQPEAALWRAVVAQRTGEPVESTAEDRREWAAIAKHYPPALRGPARLALVDTALAAGDAVQAAAILETLAAEDKDSVSPASLAYRKGKALAIAGAVDRALAAWDEAMASDDREMRARAGLARTNLALESGRMTPAEAAKALAGLRYVWRGDSLELDLAHRLGSLQIAAHDYADGLRSLKDAATLAAGGPRADAITEEMQAAFKTLFLSGEADSLSPIASVGLYEEFRELTPAGSDGDRMGERLADRLVQVDLLDRAADVLQAQVDYRLAGLDRTRVATRLAVIRLLNREPEEALKAIRWSEQPGISDELRAQRRLLEAQALASLGRADEALAQIASDKSEEADALRAGIYWERKDWPNAATSLASLVDRRVGATSASLSEEQAGLVFNLAVALTLAGDDSAVSRLQQSYGPAIAKTGWREPFAFLTSDEKLVPAQYRSLGDHAADADRFMAAWRERISRQPLSTVN